MLSITQAAVTLGDVAIIRVNNSTDGFTLLALNNLSSTDVLFWTDNGWMSTNAFRTGEGAGTTDILTANIAAGSTIDVSSTSLASSGDQLFLFTGTLSTPSLLYGVDWGNTQGWDASAADANTSAFPTALDNVNVGATMVDLGVSVGGSAGYRYKGNRMGSKGLLLSALSNAMNWESTSETSWSLGSFTVATERAWDGGGANNNWTTAANWQADTAPVAGNTLVFAGAVQTAANNDFPADTSFAGIMFQAGTSGFTIVGNALKLTSSILNQSGNLQTLNTAVTLDAAGIVFDTSSGGLTLGGNLNLNGQSLSVVGPGNTTLSGVVSGSGTAILSKFGTGILSLTNAGNTFSGAAAPYGGSNRASFTASVDLTPGSGTLKFTSDGAFGASGNNINLEQDDFAQGGLMFDADNITLSSTRTLNIDGLTTIDVQGYTATIASVIQGDDNNGVAVAGNDSFTKKGAGTLILTGTMDQVDEVFIGAGTLRAENSLDTARVTVATGSTLQFGNGNATGDINGSTATVVNNGTVVFNRTGSLSFDHVISGTGSVEHNGSGTTTLSAASDMSYTGNTTVSAGIYRQGTNIDFLPNGAGEGDVSVTGTGAIELGGFGESINGLSGDGTVRNTAASNATLTVGSDNDTATFSGLLEDGAGGGTFSFTKAGTGTQTLSGANTYTGATTVNAGTLQVDNTTGSATGTGAVTVASGAKLQGTGTISGLTAIQSGAVVEGGTGSSIGTLNFTAATLSNGSRADFHLTGNGMNDRLNITGTSGSFTVGTSASFKVFLDYSPKFGDSFNLLDWVGVGVSGDTDIADNLDFSSADLSSLGLSWDTSSFHTLGTITVVPEPGRSVLLLFGCCVLMLRRRR